MEEKTKPFLTREPAGAAALLSGNQFFMSGDITLGHRKATLKNVELGALMYNTLHKCAQELS